MIERLLWEVVLSGKNDERSSGSRFERKGVSAALCQSHSSPASPLTQSRTNLFLEGFSQTLKTEAPRLEPLFTSNNTM